MKFYGKLILGTALLSSIAMADTAVNTALSSTSLSNAILSSEEGSTLEGGKLIYRAKYFHTMATVPGFSMGAPSGLVPGYGIAFAGISGRSNSENTDGALAIGMGLGDPNKDLGGAISLSVGSIDPTDGGAFNRGALNLSVGRHFSQYKLGVSVGISGMDIWHEKRDDKMDPSFYGAVTKLFPNDVAPVVLTGGVGNNGYADIKASGDRKDKIGPFAAVAVYVMPQVSLIADYTTGITGVGVSVVPFPDYPINITLGATDLFEQAPDEKVSFVGSLSAAYVF